MAAKTYRLDAALPTVIACLPTICAFAKEGVRVSSLFPTLVDYAEGALIPDQEDDIPLELSDSSYPPAVELYYRLHDITGFRPELTSGLPKLNTPNTPEKLIQPQHRIMPKQYTTVIVAAPTGDLVPVLRGRVNEVMQYRTGVYVIVPGFCPRFPYTATLGTPSTVQGHELLLTPPETDEVLDMIAWSERVVTTSRWAMQSAVALRIPVEFISFGDFVNPYRPAYWKALEDATGYRGMEAVDIAVILI